MRSRLSCIHGILTGCLFVLFVPTGIAFVLALCGVINEVFLWPFPIVGMSFFCSLLIGWIRERVTPPEGFDPKLSPIEELAVNTISRLKTAQISHVHQNSSTWATTLCMLRLWLRHPRIALRAFTVTDEDAAEEIENDLARVIKLPDEPEEPPLPLSQLARSASLPEKLRILNVTDSEIFFEEFIYCERGFQHDRPEEPLYVAILPAKTPSRVIVRTGYHMDTYLCSRDSFSNCDLPPMYERVSVVIKGSVREFGKVHSFEDQGLVPPGFEPWLNLCFPDDECFNVSVEANPA